MTREEIIEHMKVMGQNAARMDEVMMYVMTRKDCEVVMAAAKLLEALPPTHIHEEYPEHDWYRNEDGTINGSAMDCDTHSGPMCKRCGDSFCVFCEPDGFETHKPCVIDKFVCPECGRVVLDGQKFCSHCGRGLIWYE